MTRPEVSRVFRNGFRFLGVTLAFALIVFSTARAIGSPSTKDEPMADCSFSHPQLPGVCSATVPIPSHSTPLHACEAVLRCINGSACADAQKYCPNPGVSKDWKLLSAKPATIITASTPRVNCGYSNPGYSGWCVLMVPVPQGMTPLSACEAVLPCMNGGACPGYVHSCGPEIRSGWKLAQIQPVKTPQPTPRH